MNNEDSKKQAQTSKHQPTQSQRDTSDNSQNSRKSETGENRTKPQDVSKKTPEQGGGSTQDHGKDNATHDRHEKAS